MKGLIVIPTYNERENIERIISKICATVKEVNILVVDDNSPDGTANIVVNIVKNNKRVKLLQRADKMGLGTAYIEGFKYAIEKGYDFVGEMDADLSHQPEDLKKLILNLKKADVVVGSRYVNKGKVENWPFMRLLLSTVANVYAKLLTGIPVKDLTAGFVLYNRKVIESLPLDKIKTDGYGFQIEVKYYAYRNGFKIMEVPIKFMDRKIGKSKMNGKIINQAFFLVLKLFYRRVVRRIM